MTNRSLQIPALLLAVALGHSNAATAQENPPPEPTPVPTPTPSSSASSTYFNPAIAVIGNFLGIAGRNPVDKQDSLQLRESELSLQAIVDPYARADFFLSFSNSGVDVEEGFVTFLSLPANLQVKLGKFKAQFGKVNTLHLHVLPWPDEPLPIVNLLGSEDGWADAGASIARVFELPGDTYSDLTAQIFRGKTEGLFEAPTRGDLAYNAQYRVYRDFGDDHNAELGASWGHGYNGTAPNGTTTLENLHLVYRWKPLQGRPHRSFVLRSELFRSSRGQPNGRQVARGFYVAGDWQLARRWFVGTRYEFSDHADAANLRDEGYAATLTFWPSEFSQLRGEYRHRRYSGGRHADEALFQVQFAIGAHGAHPF